MSRILLLVGFGGFIGTVARYLTSLWFLKLLPSAFPFGTFAVNIIGSFIIGIVIGLTSKYNWFTPEWRFFLATGVCGGYTTFSSFTLENVKLLQDGNYKLFFLYSIGSFLLGIAAVLGGLVLANIK